MGKSLVPGGGQNPIEPAKLGCAVLYGPHVDNFSEVYGELAAAKARRPRRPTPTRWRGPCSISSPTPRGCAAWAARASRRSRSSAAPRAASSTAVEPFLAQIAIDGALIAARARLLARRTASPPRLLAPLGALYGALAATAVCARPAPRAALPTIVVGGLTAGGDGKTPLVIALADILAANGRAPRPAHARLWRAAGVARPSLSIRRDDSVKRPATRRCCWRAMADDRRRRPRGERGAGARSLARLSLILDDGFHSRRLGADLRLLVDRRAIMAPATAAAFPPARCARRSQAQLAAADALVVDWRRAPAGSALVPRALTLIQARTIADGRQGLLGRRGSPLSRASDGRRNSFRRLSAVGRGDRRDARLCRSPSLQR